MNVASGLTEKEHKFLELRFRGMKNKEIALTEKTSEPDVSQTLSRAMDKLQTVQDTIEFMQSIGLVSCNFDIEFTENGKKMFRQWTEQRPERVRNLRIALDKQTGQSQEVRLRAKNARVRSHHKVNDTNVSIISDIFDRLDSLDDRTNKLVDQVTHKDEFKQYSKEQDKPKYPSPPPDYVR